MILVRSLLAFLVILLFISNTGCWDLREMEELNLELSAGFDYDEEEELITYTALTGRPSGMLGGEEAVPGISPVTINHNTGKTLFEASRNFAARSPRRIFQAHIRNFIIGEEMAKNRITELADFIIREREHRMTPWIFVTGVTAGEILRAESEGEPTLAEEIDGIMETLLPLSTSPRITVKDFLISFNKPGEDAFAPVIKIREEEEPPEEDLFTDDPEGETKRFIIIEGTAVFSRDKLAGYLTVPETKGLLWTRGEVIRANIIPVPPDGGQVSVQIIRGGAELNPEFKDDKLKIEVQVETEGDITASNIKKDITDTKVIRELEMSLANMIKQEVLLSVAKSQEYNSDFLSFGAAFRRENPDRWAEIKEDWREKHLSQVEVEVRVKAKLRRKGMISESLMVE